MTAKRLSAHADVDRAVDRRGEAIAPLGECGGFEAASLRLEIHIVEPAEQSIVGKVLYCASGGRSALTGKVLRDMGCTDVHNLGGFKDAVDAGFELEPD